MNGKDKSGCSLISSVAALGRSNSNEVCVSTLLTDGTSAMIAARRLQYSPFKLGSSSIPSILQVSRTLAFDNSFMEDKDDDFGIVIVGPDCRPRCFLSFLCGRPNSLSNCY